jgi:hypothetical protein
MSSREARVASAMPSIAAVPALTNSDTATFIAKANHAYRYKQFDTRRELRGTSWATPILARLNQPLSDVELTLGVSIPKKETASGETVSFSVELPLDTGPVKHPSLGAARMTFVPDAA